MAATNFLNEPIVCDLGVFSKEERAEHIALGGKLFAKCTEFKETDDGFELTFDASVSVSDIQTWYTNESKCCRFTAYELTTEAQEQKTLLIQSSDAGKDYLRQTYQWLMGGTLTAPAKQNTGFFKLGTAMAAILCLACVIPIVGGFLVAKGIVSSFYNPGEIVWIGLGVVILALWYARSWFKKRSQKNKEGCGC